MLLYTSLIYFLLREIERDFVREKRGRGEEKKREREREYENK